MGAINFLPDQYKKTEKLPINHNYLAEQFADYDIIFNDIKKVVLNGDFTLGLSVDNLEEEIKKQNMSDLYAKNIDSLSSFEKEQLEKFEKCVHRQIEITLSKDFQDVITPDNLKEIIKKAKAGV